MDGRPDAAAPAALPYGFDLSGRTALVTGASSGLGKAFAEALARSGARVVLVARREALLEEVAVGIAAAGGEVGTAVADVTDEASVAAAFDYAERRFGPVDSLIANAGVTISDPALETDARDFARIVSTNINGVFLAAREGARRMIANGAAERAHGRIVIISSITASYVVSGLAAYSASKAGVLQMGRVLAREWVRLGVNVNMLLPGYVSTELNDRFFASEAGGRFLQRFPRRRLLAEADFLPLLVYLCSDSARTVTGASFTIDDGQTL